MSERILRAEVTVPAPVEDVWAAWTTEKGVRSFFAPDARIELKVNGAYEILFDLDEPEGRKGSEGSKILSYVPEQMLSFSWGAPPEFEESRKEIAQWVVLFFTPLGDKRTLVRFLELGWKDSEESRQVYDYFDKAWLDVVLPRLLYRFTVGPVDWNRPPKLSRNYKGGPP